MNKAYITIMVHKPAGIYEKPWFSVTWTRPNGHSGSTPFENARDISKYVDEAKKIISQGFIIPPEIKLVHVKEDPLLSFCTREKGTVDWKEIFATKE